MSKYSAISNFRVIELLGVIGLILILNSITFKSYEFAVTNSFAGNYILAIQDIKTKSVVDASFEVRLDKSVTHISNDNDGFRLEVLKSAGVDADRWISVFISDNKEDMYMQSPLLHKAFVGKQLTMYQKKTGVGAFQFISLSCDNFDHGVGEQNIKHNGQVNKYVEKRHYRSYCR